MPPFKPAATSDGKPIHLHLTHKTLSPLINPGETPALLTLTA